MKVWNTLKTTYKVSDFIGWQKDGGLKLNPFFQRRSVWKSGAKSYLIDTIIRGFPIPIIFLRDAKSDLTSYSPLRDVVDGQQRLRTVIAYIAPELLKDFDSERDVFVIEEEHNKQFAGKSFAELPVVIRNHILDYQFTVNVFPSDTSDGEVKQVFARMNSSGYKLNDQELRNAEYFGKFKTLMYDLSTEQLNRWRKWKVFSLDQLARMLEVELTSELVIVMLQGISEKTEKGISKFYDDYDKQFPQGAEVARRFRVVCDTIDSVFGIQVSIVFRKRTLFYAFFTTVYDLLYEMAPLDAKKKPNKAITQRTWAALLRAGERIAAEKAPQAVMDATTRRTTHARERRTVKDFLIRSARNAQSRPE